MDCTLDSLSDATTSSSTTSLTLWINCLSLLESSTLTPIPQHTREPWPPQTSSASSGRYWRTSSSSENRGGSGLIWSRVLQCSSVSSPVYCLCTLPGTCCPPPCPYRHVKWSNMCTGCACVCNASVFFSFQVNFIHEFLKMSSVSCDRDAVSSIVQSDLGIDACKSGTKAWLS